MEIKPTNDHIDEELEYTITMRRDEMELVLNSESVNVLLLALNHLDSQSYKRGGKKVQQNLQMLRRQLISLLLTEFLNEEEDDEEEFEEEVELTKKDFMSIGRAADSGSDGAINALTEIA